MTEEPLDVRLNRMEAEKESLAVLLQAIQRRAKALLNQYETLPKPPGPFRPVDETTPIGYEVLIYDANLREVYPGVFDRVDVSGTYGRKAVTSVEATSYHKYWTPVDPVAWAPLPRYDDGSDKGKGRIDGIG